MRMNFKQLQKQPTNLKPQQTLQFAYMLELVNCNAITFLDNKLTRCTRPDFYVVTKNLHVSLLG